MKIKEKRNLWEYDDFVVKIGIDPDYSKIIILELDNQIYNKLKLKGVDLNKIARFIPSSYKYDSFINATSGWDNLFLHKSIEDRNKFMDNILGYNDDGHGTFPYVNNIDDAIKLVNAAIKKILQI